MKLKPKLSPVKVAVFPLQKDEKLKKKASDLVSDLKKTYVCEFDDSGNIGQMYRRQDEIGTPFCVTIDYQTIEDETVTVRERDSMAQERVIIDELREYLVEKLI